MKNKFSLGASLCVGLAVIGGALTPAAYAQDAQGNAANTCQNPGVEIVDGKIHWGIKESFRNYINGPIARGSWTLQAQSNKTAPRNKLNAKKIFSSTLTWTHRLPKSSSTTLATLLIPRFGPKIPL